MTATLVLSGTSNLGTPPMAAKALVWAPIKSPSACVQVTSALVKLEAPEHGNARCTLPTRSAV